ncbi:MAG TPA: adenylate/guanylate cyclase domain-containing protein [Burkholderiaceae bacterium]|nr:adenylate/guanylate cyclase domain-containing protein [Burkholderiaceae bacterium]
MVSNVEPAVAAVPRHLAERILESRAAIEGERKQVTILFADMKGSLEMLADRDPEEARRILDPVLQRMMDAVHRFEGTVNQVLGDGIMALFGAPLAHEDHAVRACFAALRLQESIARYTEQVRRTHGAEVQIRVGLNSGEVVVRSIGSDLRMDYTAVGATTSLAARMEQLASPGTTRLTAATLALAEGYIEARPLGPIPVKGMAEPVQAYELVRDADARTRLHARRLGGLARFVGRDTEMAQLRRAAQLAGRGHGQIVALVGEAGVGKSRLYYEFARTPDVQGWRVLEANSVSYGKASSFLPVAELLRAYFRIDRRDDSRAIRAKVTGSLLTLDEALRDVVPAALWLLDVQIDDSPFAQLDSTQRRRVTLDAMKRLVLRESQLQPILVVFEDLHWIDAETQAFLDLLVDSVPAAAVLLAVNFRPEYAHGWAGKTFYQQLRIDPLPDQSAAELLGELLGTDRSVDPLKHLLAERTQGNPLYIEESVRTLIETGVLAGPRGQHRLIGHFDPLSIAPSVQAIIAARIDRLDPGDKRLLEAAAVVGIDVPYVLLRVVAERAEDELRSALARLQAAEFLYEARLFPELEYTFKHALTHDVAYAGVLSERRRALHAAILGAAEQLLGDDAIGRYVERLAHHAVQADSVPKALHYLRLAGAKAAARCANREAVASFEHALTLLNGLPQTPEILRQALDIRMALGPVLMALKGDKAPEIEALYQGMQDLVTRLDDRERRFPVLWGLWRTAYGGERFDEARAVGERLLESVRDGGDSGLLLEAHHTLWPTLTGLGDARGALHHAERGIALYDRARHGSLAALYSGHDAGTCCRMNRALSLWILGCPDQAVVALEDAHHLADQVGHPLSTFFVHLFDALVNYQRGDISRTTMQARLVVDICERYALANWAVIGHVLLAAIARDPPPIERLVELQAAACATTAWYRTFCLLTLAELFAAQARVDLAREALGAIAPRACEALFASEIERVEGELSLRQPQPSIEQAVSRFRRAVSIAHDRGALSFELRAAIALARTLQRAGDRAEANATLRPVLAAFAEGLDTADQRYARAVLETT